MSLEPNMPPSDNEGVEVNLLEYFSLLTKHYKVILLAGLVGIILGVGYYTTQPKIYKASARMKIDPFQRSSLDYGDTATPLAGVYYFRAEYMNTEFQIMRSRNVITAVVEDLTPEYLEGKMAELKPVRRWFNPMGVIRKVLSSFSLKEAVPPVELTQEQKRKNRVARIRNVIASQLEIVQMRDTTLVDITMKSRSPAIARQVCNSLVRAYLSHGMQLEFEQNSRRLEFIDGTIKEYTDKMQTLQAQKAQLTDDTNMVGTSRGTSIDAERVSQLNQSLIQANIGMLDAQEKYRKLQNSEPDNSRMVAKEPVVASVAKQLADKDTTFEGLKSLGARHPTKQALQKEINALRLSLADIQRTTYDRLAGDLRSEVEGKEKTMGRIQVELDVARADSSSNQGDYQTRIAAIEANILATRKQIADLQAKQESYTLAIQLKNQDVTRSDRTLVEEAMTPKGAFAPDLKRYVAGGMILGVLLAIALIFISEITDRKIHTVELLERVTGLPNLAMVPRISEKILGKACRDHRIKIFHEVVESLGKIHGSKSHQKELDQIRDIAMPFRNDEGEKISQENQSKDLEKISALANRVLKTEHSAYLENIALSSRYAMGLDPASVAEAARAQQTKSANKSNKGISQVLSREKNDEEVAYGDTQNDTLYGLRKVVGCFTHIKPASPFSEAYRHLRTNIQLSDTKEKKILLLTSSVPGEGKTISSINLAIAFSQLKKRTLLIDGDLRRSKLHKVFSLGNEVGMVNHLVGQNLDITSCTQKTFIPYLDLLSAGTPPPNPAELLASDKMATLMLQLRELYDFVIIDSSPVLAVTDSCIIGNLADATLFVSKASKTNREEAASAIQILRSNKIKPIGTLFNDLDNSRKYGYGKSSYGYGGYGYGYGYGYSYKPEKA